MDKEIRDLSVSRDHAHTASGARADGGDVDPCPFCGGPAAIISTHDHLGVENFYGNCDACDAYGPSGADRAEAVERWNRRPKAPASSLRDREAEG